MRPAAARRPTRRAIVESFAVILGASFLLARSSPGRAIPKRHLKWVAFYGYTGDERILAGYDIVVLDPGFAGSIPAVSARGARVCGYVSLGEIRRSDPFYDRVEPAALLEPNPDWPGTVRVDARHPSWRKLILEAIIPGILRKGFTGIMLDTADTPVFLEQADPRANHGMAEAAAEIVREISARYPSLFLTMNRGYGLLPRVIDCLDAIMAESLLTTPDPTAPMGVRWNDKRQVDLQLSLLTPASRHRPAVPILSLDYWHPDDVTTIRQIYARERQAGHHPYVATQQLDHVLPEPARAVSP